jgi:hypothetical protein
MQPSIYKVVQMEIKLSSGENFTHSQFKMLKNKYWHLSVTKLKAAI